MPITITNNIQKFSRSLAEHKLKKICALILKELGKSDHNVNVVLTDDVTIQGFNKKYRNIDKPTNVLSFPFAEGNEGDLAALPIYELGDILISVETASREATDYNQSFEHRLSWLLVHGFLHLIGYDHERSLIEAEKMFRKEKEVLGKINTERGFHMMQLAINVDHVATVRQARGVSEPDPVTAAAICELAGAQGIVVHLREDRRHIQDKDVYLLRKTVKTKLNLEMGANKEIIDIALDVIPDMVTLVPEKRQELTTEGGLNVVGQKKKLAKVVKRFNKAGIPVSIFVDPDSQQIKASHDIGAHFVEIHTGRYCDAVLEKEIDKEFELIASAAEEAYQLGLVVNGGHGLDYQNTSRIAALETIEELSIGHAIISRSIFSGLETAVRDMLNIINTAQLQRF